MHIEIIFLDYIQNNLRTPISDLIMTFCSSIGDNGIIWIILDVILFLRKETRLIGAIVFISLTLDVILCNGVLKPLIARVRPCDINTTIQLLVPHPDDFSFPSGHTAASFTTSFSLFFAGAKKLSIPAFIIATFISFSRMYLYVHYPTDIFAGILLGLLCGYTGCLLIKVILVRKKIMEKCA